MPRFILNGQVLDLNDREYQGFTFQLARMTSANIWMRPKLRAEYYIDRWQTYANHPGLLRHIVEAAGGASLPRQAIMRSLAQRKRHLEADLRPARIHRFYANFPDWYRDLHRFSLLMSGYIDRFEEGGVRTVARLELVRDGSFTLLRNLAMMSIAAPAAALAATGTTGAVQALTGTVALNIAIRQTSSEVRNVSRRLSGTPPSRLSQEQEIIDNAIDALNDAALAGLLDRLLRPITAAMGPLIERAIQRNQLGEAIALDEVKRRIDNVVGDAINQMTRSARQELREIIRQAMHERSPDAAARRAATLFMNNRRFRTLVAQRLSD